MAPITRKRGPEWQHRDAERRAAAVTNGSDKELLAALPRLATDDESPDVRLAAVRRLDDWTVLAQVAQTDTDAGVAGAARERALARLAREELDDPGPAEPLLESAGPEERLKLLREAASPALRRRLLEDVDDPKLLAERCLKDGDRALRARALEKLSDPGQLERVVRGLKGADKRLRRDAEEKLETLRIEAGDIEACRRRAHHVVESLEAMTRHGDTDPDRRSALERQWAELPAEAREPLQRRFEGACRILEHAANPPAPPPEPETGAPTEEPAGEASQAPPGPTAEVVEELTRLVHEAELLAEQEKPSAEAAAELQARWSRAVDGAEEAGEVRDLAETFQAALERVARRRREADQARHTARETLDAYIESLEANLEAGVLHKAREADHELAAFLRENRPHQTAAQRRRLAAAHRRLHELRDWQHWANNRVRKRLCEEVEALPESDLHPDAMLEALKRAQKEWRELEESEKLGSEKRAYRASGPGLWKRFQAAGKRAFDHAKPFLEKRSELREQNLEQVRALIGELESARASEEIDDPRELAELLSRARRALSRLGELPPPERGPTARTLRELLGDLGGRLDQAREALARDKEALIREAESLDPDADLSRAISQAKAIMGRWKKLDTLPRGRERKLWQRLRDQLDPVFERRDAEQAEAREKQAIEQQGLESLCAELERLAELPGPELEAATTDLNRLRGQWQQHRQRPAALEGRFRRALDAFRHRLAEQRTAARFEAIRGLFERARLCRQAESGALSPADAESAWNELPPLDGGQADALQERFRRATTKQTPTDTGDNARRAARQVLTMELIAGVDSPPEAASDRMALKVDRLNQSMRGERPERDPEEEMEELLSEWAATGPLPDDEGESLEHRVAETLESFYKIQLKD